MYIICKSSVEILAVYAAHHHGEVCWVKARACAMGRKEIRMAGRTDV